MVPKLLDLILNGHDSNSKVTKKIMVMKVNLLPLAFAIENTGKNY
jgi:hypothetical protein